MKELLIDGTLRLRPYREDDIPRLVKFLNEEGIGRNTLSIPQPYTLKDAEEWIQLCRSRFESQGRHTNWAIEWIGEGLIGGIGRLLHFGLDSHRDEIGYWLAADRRGRGIMTRVVRAFTERLHQEGLVRITAAVFSYNHASARVLQKAGYRYEGTLRKAYFKNGEYIDAFLFASIAPELAADQPPAPPEALPSIL